MSGRPWGPDLTPTPGAPLRAQGSWQYGKSPAHSRDGLSQAAMGRLNREPRAGHRGLNSSLTSCLGLGTVPGTGLTPHSRAPLSPSPCSRGFCLCERSFQNPLHAGVVLETSDPNLILGLGPPEQVGHGGQGCGQKQRLGSDIG